MISTEWIWGIGIVILGAAIAYALIRNRSRTPAEKRLTEAMTKQRYREEDRKEGVRPMPE